MKNRKLLIAMLALSLVLVTALFLTGCGKKEQPAEDQSAQTQTEQPADDQSAAPAADDTAAPADGSTASDQSDPEYIGEDKALEIAISDAGLTQDGVTNAFAHLDYDDDSGRYEYEVEFHVGTTEYSYDIDAVTGEIRDKDIDNDD